MFAFSRYPARLEKGVRLLASRTVEQGYLYIETSLSHPGRIRLRMTKGAPPSPAITAADPAIVYVARFSDVEAGRLHAFSALRHRLLDVDSGLFQVELPEAIAVVESIGLAHSRLFMDPALDATTRKAIADRTMSLQRRREQIDRIWQAVGWVALGWLAFLALSAF